MNRCIGREYALHRKCTNEVVVAAFLRDEISFLGMSDVIEHTMGQVSFVQTPTYDDYVANRCGSTPDCQ